MNKNNSTVYFFIIMSLVLSSCTLHKPSINTNPYTYDGDTVYIKKDTIQFITNKQVKQVKQITIPEDDAVVEFVGTSELQKAIANSSELPLNAGIGVFFTKNYGTPTKLLKVDRLELELKITIASTIDTIKGVYVKNTLRNERDFGNSILLPYSSKQSLSFSFRTFSNNLFLNNGVISKNLGFEGSLNASNRVWLDSSGHKNIMTLSASVGMFTEMLPKKNRGDFSISLGLDLSARWIFGDIGQDKNNEFRSNIIGTNARFFGGIEPNLTIRMKNLKAAASFPFLFSKDQVAGLTNGQLITFIRFTGGFPIDLGKSK